MHSVASRCPVPNEVSKPDYAFSIEVWTHLHSYTPQGIMKYSLCSNGLLLCTGGAIRAMLGSVGHNTIIPGSIWHPINTLAYKADKRVLYKGHDLIRL